MYISKTKQLMELCCQKRILEIKEFDFQSKIICQDMQQTLAEDNKISSSY
jgi:hypothetical protein